MRRRACVSILTLAIATALAMVLLPALTYADAVTDWTPGPGAVGDNTYDGFIDLPTNNATIGTGSFTASGWFVDKTAQGWAGADDVQLWLGTMDGGGQLLTRLNFAQSRPDVAAAEGNPFWAASGFNGVVPPNALAVGPQTLSVYAHTPAAVPSVSGAALPIVAIEKPKDGEQVLTKSDYEIMGYALDRTAAPNQGVAGSGIDRVSVYIGAREDPNSVFLGDADLGFSDATAASLYGGQFQSAGWRLTFKPTQFHANTYLMYAYAHSAVSGKEDSAVRFFAIKEH
jgi:hypothetical protein